MPVADESAQAQLTVADAMVPTTESVTSHQTAAAAAKIMSQRSLGALPVVESGRVVGIVTPLQLLTAPPYRPVVNVMIPIVTPATPQLSLVQAYAVMARQRVDVLPVAEDGTIVGQISATAILRKQSQQNDPLTGLPASTALRAWAMAALERGLEISILFIDLDNFGAVNKVLGHVAGDDVLRTVAQLLNRLVDEKTDLLSRYGGDEFAIATTRHEAEARTLMERLQDAVILPVEMGEVVRNVTVSIGIAGGRRAESRKRAHTAATTDDLITLASRASTAAKEAKRAAEAASSAALERALGPTGETPPAAAGRAERRLHLVDVTVQTDEHGGAAAVTLRLGGREVTGQAAGPVHGQALLFLIVEATLQAVRQAAGEVDVFVLEQLTEVATPADKLVVVVLSRSMNGRRLFVGSALGPDATHAVVKAVLHALNRRLALTLAANLPSDRASP